MERVVLKQWTAVYIIVSLCPLLISSTLSPVVFPSSRADSDDSLLHFIFAATLGSNRNDIPGYTKCEGKGTSI